MKHLPLKIKDNILFISQFILRFIRKLKPDTGLAGVSDAFVLASVDLEVKSRQTYPFFLKIFF